MLIEAAYKVGDIVTLKMVGGDEVVAKLDEKIDGAYILAKPLVVMMAQQGFGLAPFVLTANPEARLTVNADAVICITKTFDRVAKEYIKQTTGLIT
jgi:hypothetical protein